ncbi:MAG: hypothetical protein CMJ29_03410 [Phycisphaerae bacterium]|nr:hypothetical protein [Phycisphaerae bacterium]|tara:strand:- start:413 stop:1021 length:609 start_codon:yes stop_codon:yes gene_type:complete
MSKIRERQFDHQGDLTAPTPDTQHWVVYTQKKADSPFKWAGSLNAPDLELAMQFAGEHYGLDEACVALIAHHADYLTDGPCGKTPLLPSDASGSDGSSWTVFTLPRRGGNLQQAGTVNAPDAETAIDRATAEFANGKIHQIRVVPSDKIYMMSSKSELVWRLHDMDYKFAKGYSKGVRSKWTRIRDSKEYEEYRKEDIHKHF